jgi:hypothetical protein
MIILSISGITIVLFLMLLINSYKFSKLKKKYYSFMNKIGKGENIEELFKEYLKKADEITKENKEIMNYCNQLERNMMGCIQKVGIIRYNAFTDMGSDLCFAIAFLDANNSGVVINGIYSREGCSTFAKPIINGESKYNLTAEEIQAIDKAKSSSTQYYSVAN